MLAILNFLNAHNLPIFQPILMILESKLMVHRAFSDKTYLSLGLLSISGFVHAHHSCGGKRGKLFGSHLSAIFKFESIQVSDTFTSGGDFRIFWTK